MSSGDPRRVWRPSSEPWENEQTGTEGRNAGQGAEVFGFALKSCEIGQAGGWVGVATDEGWKESREDRGRAT